MVNYLGLTETLSLSKVKYSGLKVTGWESGLWMVTNLEMVSLTVAGNSNVSRMSGLVKVRLSL